MHFNDAGTCRRINAYRIIWKPQGDRRVLQRSRRKGERAIYVAAQIGFTPAAVDQRSKTLWHFLHVPPELVCGEESYHLTISMFSHVGFVNIYMRHSTFSDNVLLNPCNIIMIFVRISVYFPVFIDRVLFQYAFYDLRKQYHVQHDKLYGKGMNN